MKWIVKVWRRWFGPSVTRTELMKLTDEAFVEEYNKYRSEALRRAK